MDQYTEGFRAGYAQAIGDADARLKQQGDDRITRHHRRSVLALVEVNFEPDHLCPVPDWSRYTVPGVDQEAR